MQMKLKVLFIGNSHTYLHYMPQMLVQLVKAKECGFYSIIARTSPEGLPHSLFIEGKFRPNQESEQALLLQKLAWETVLNSESGMRKWEG